MKRLVINKLYIFSTKDSEAKIVEFLEGSNIVTSNRKTGNKTGKSIILKSLYHTLGADCDFPDNWKVDTKTYIIDMNINENQYYIYRSHKYFKVLSKEYKVLHKTMSRLELSEFLKGLYDFSVMLPNQKENKLEYAPPAFNYILNYVDQAGIKLTEFSSFKNLRQFSEYKENLLYYHFGVIDEKYYEIIKDLEEVTDSEKENSNKKDIIENMLSKILKDIENFDYAKSMETLNIEIENSKEEYTEIIGKLHNTKKILINLKNEREDLKIVLDDLKLSRTKNEKNIKVLEKHTCPTCNSKIGMEILLNKYNSTEDMLFLSNELQINLLETDNKIEKEEDKYKELLNILNKYEEKININSEEINDILKHKGFIEIKESLIKELGQYTIALKELQNKKDELIKLKKVYDKQKAQINSKYCELMIEDKEKFKLEEIDEKKLKNISGAFKATGSTMPIATIIWYFNLLKIKYIFNKDTIHFPIVLDSPKNAELDETNEREFFNYILENSDKNSQLIVSTLEMGDELVKNIKCDNVIKLENEQYKLLNKEDFNNSKEFLQKIIDAN